MADTWGRMSEFEDKHNPPRREAGIIREDNSMARPRNRLEMGHDFDFGTGACTRCGMTRPYFEDSGKPPCAGRRPADGWPTIEIPRDRVRKN